MPVVEQGAWPCRLSRRKKVAAVRVKRVVAPDKAYEAWERERMGSRVVERFKVDDFR